MLIETTTPPRAAWRVEAARIGHALLDPRLAIILILALLAGTLAYQAPATSDIPVGWIGDRLFLRASEGQAAGDAHSFYGDEITAHATSGRSRWTHAGADVWLPGLGPGDLTVTIRAQGWPEDTLNQRVRQPAVTVLGDGQPLGSFTPGPGWATHTIQVPAAIRASDDLLITLETSDVLTGTRTFADPRPKGVRVEMIGVRADASGAFQRPAALPLAALALNGALWLLTLLALTGRANLSFTLTTALMAALALALVLARSWAAALLPWCALVGVLALGWAWRAAIGGLLVRLVRAYGRGEALNYGLVAASACWLLAGIAWASSVLPMPALRVFRATFPDSLIYGLLGMCLLLLAFVLGRRGLPQITLTIVRAISSRSGARALLGALLLGWGAYLASVIAVLPYVGHADYADNAVVARNLVAGRGWVVDYVSQFYQLYPGLTRPQETWPLMQPVWIAPFFALLGASDWAAKLPNLLFALALGVLIYIGGTRLWDRRVGLTAAATLLTSHLFFKLVIYATSDLAFVLFAFGAIWMLYRATLAGGTAAGLAPGGRALRTIVRRPHVAALLGSAVFTGLMILQKPGSGGIIALGMGAWLLLQGGRARQSAEQSQRPPLSARRSALSKALLWGMVAGALVLPLVARNVLTFGKLYYSTESYDAWVLEYTDWDRIYAVYVPELGGQGAPDRSWLLRWGFDRAFTKVVRQLEAARDYLVPGWQGLPGSLAGLAGRGDKDLRLLFDTGAWLALIGAVGALGARRRLIGLLAAAFGPYTLFLALYWHANEERYFVVMMPWLALLAAAALWRIYDRVAAIRDGRWAPLGLLMVLVALGLVAGPSWPEIDKKVRSEPQLYAADLDLYAWLRANTPAGAAMMTRNPWQLNWHSERPAVMIPYTTDRETLLRLARHYRVRYLVLDSLQRPEPEVRALIAQMLEDPGLGFRLAYQTPVYVAEYGGARKEIQAEVFSFPDDYGGVAPIR